MRWGLFLLALGCRPNVLKPEELRDPQVCAECHPDHVKAWSGSMHAYAGIDPVFRAMNAVGQRETGGELGDFCIKCHAPAAVALGLDTEDLDALDPSMLGVTCWFCHQVTSVEDDHNNPLRVADDNVFRGPIVDPVETKAHGSVYAATHDREDPDASAMCGSCHDIITPLGAHIERTYAEWQGSLFAKPGFGLTCPACHMPGREGLAAEVEGVPLRRVHGHEMAGVDIALTPFPEQDAQKALVQEFLDDSLSAFLCVNPGGPPTLAIATLENVASGHFFPSGATADRRVWVEVVAYEGDEIVGQSGRVSLDEAVGLRTDAEDPDLWRLWSTLLDADGAPTHHFWEAADIASENLLPVQATSDPNDPDYVSTHVSRNYLFREGVPDRVTMAVYVEPIGQEILQPLVDSGDLDPAVLQAVPRFTLAPTQLEWTRAMPVNAGSLSCVPAPPPLPGAAP